MDRDPKTEIHIKIDDGSIFKVLIGFLNEIVISDDIYMRFSEEGLKISHRAKDQDNGFFIDIFVIINRWNLTEYQYVSKKKSYILGLETSDIVSLVKSCNKNDYFVLQREGNPGGGVRTTKSPKEFNYCQEVSTIRYNKLEEKEFTTPKSKPVCVVTGSEFCNMCSSFKDKNPKSSETVKMTIFETGLIFSSSVKDNSGKIKQGQIKYLGHIPDDTTKTNKISCITSKKNIAKLTTLKKICPNGNLRIYIERDDKKNLKPLKLVYKIGSFGKITIYIEVEDEK